MHRCLIQPYSSRKCKHIRRQSRLGIVMSRPPTNCTIGSFIQGTLVLESVCRCWESPLVSSLFQSTGNINEIMLRAHLHYYLFFFRKKLRHKEQKTWIRQHLAKLGMDIYLWRSYCLPLILRSPFHDAGTVSSQIRGGWEGNSAMLRFQLWLQPELATASRARGH